MKLLLVGIGLLSIIYLSQTNMVKKVMKKYKCNSTVYVLIIFTSLKWYFSFFDNDDFVKW